MPSTSAMASPLVCVLKGKDGTGGIRLAVDYKYVNSLTQNDAYIMPNLNDLMQKVGSANYDNRLSLRILAVVDQTRRSLVDCIRLRWRPLGMDQITFRSKDQWKFICSLCSGDFVPC